jgi:fatty-acyl-CoA synthase
MMEQQLTIPAIMRRASRLFGHTEVVSRAADGTLTRYSYAQMLERATRLGAALRGLGVRPGDRVATLAWNDHRHLETYFGVPAIGAVLHTLNLRLHPRELAYVMAHGGARVVVVDASLLPLFAQVQQASNVEHVVVLGDATERPTGALDYEMVLKEVPAGADGDVLSRGIVTEEAPASLCYTSGTTGRPKGILYSHRAIVLQAMNWTAADTVGARRRDTMLAVVPMFHINGWCLPFTAALVGAKLVLPNRMLEAGSLLELIAGEGVTLSAGVPTVWLGVLDELERRGTAAEVASLRTLVIGGASVPRTLVQGYAQRGVTVLQAWGMTETTALATVSTLPPELETAAPDAQYGWRTKQGTPMPLIEVQARGDNGVLVPWDGETMGELEVRGPAVARRYYNDETEADRFTADGWFKTGDVVTIDAQGCVEIKDRTKDLIRSGGEWISSVALENALMNHPAVAEAVVIAVPHPWWSERPLAVVVLRAGRHADATMLENHLAAEFPKWWLPERFEFVNEIPRTSTGKFKKSTLRTQYARSLSPAFES